MQRGKVGVAFADIVASKGQLQRYVVEGVLFAIGRRRRALRNRDGERGRHIAKAYPS